jgi:hypothetical protein
MSYTKRKRIYGKRKQYSVIGKLEKENKINDQFQIMMNRLTLEEVIAVKLELAAKAAGGNIFGIPIWYTIIDIVRDACLKFALSSTRTQLEASRFLGLNIRIFNIYLQKFGVKAYFVDEDESEGQKKKL